VRPPGREARLPQIHGLQTSTGFTVSGSGPGTDPRTVLRVEPGSDAERAGLKAGDTIVQVDGKPNYLVLSLYGTEDGVKNAAERLQAAGGSVVQPAAARDELWAGEVGFEARDAARAAQSKVLDLSASGGDDVNVHDTLGDMVRDWPRGKHSLSLVV